MKKPTPIDEEYTFEDGVIVSETDLKGVITYANRTFCKIAGYDKEELLGKPHNIIRHPDMPKAAFKDMWETIKKDKEWIGLVKNLRKDGRYYWVKTYIKPVFKDGVKVGYIAARKPVSKEDKEEAELKYKMMREKEQN
ncbi:PAS domain-containing protein [Nitrosophilus kaiyonis]|uniref:PAS domain-containing protein n=1 Tax=Nitrosophilus kaiyonis TaxID=2930200 RepID=UPI0024921B87|nr:PAS domain S-box protein [Nitrosophilus kaiyonis]